MQKRCRRHGRLEGCGFRLTEGRRVVFETLAGTREHLSAEDIYFRVREKNPTLGLTTVYRTLELLCEQGIAQKHDFGDGRARFELSENSGGKGHHHHLTCTRCGRVIDYSDFVDEEKELLEKTEKSLSKKFNFRITGHVIQFEGLCPKCDKKT